MRGATVFFWTLVISWTSIMMMRLSHPHSTSTSHDDCGAKRCEALIKKKVSIAPKNRCMSEREKWREKTTTPTSLKSVKLTMNEWTVYPASACTNSNIHVFKQSVFNNAVDSGVSGKSFAGSWLVTTWTCIMRWGDSFQPRLGYHDGATVAPSFYRMPLL